MAGTYRVEICRGPCTGQPGDSVLARGHVVVESKGYPLSSLPPRARALAESEVFLRVRVPDEIVDPNACFAFGSGRGAGPHRSFAEALGVGFTLAGLRSDSLVISLYQSPDAGYGVVLGRAGDELRGRARFRGTGDWAVPEPEDSVLARRIGPPDRSLCIRAAEAEAARHGVTGR